MKSNGRRLSYRVGKRFDESIHSSRKGKEIFPANKLGKKRKEDHQTEEKEIDNHSQSRAPEKENNWSNQFLLVCQEQSDISSHHHEPQWEKGREMRVPSYTRKGVRAR